MRRARQQTHAYFPVTDISLGASAYTSLSPITLLVLALQHLEYAQNDHDEQDERTRFRHIALARVLIEASLRRSGYLDQHAAPRASAWAQHDTHFVSNGKNSS